MFERIAIIATIAACIAIFVAMPIAALFGATSIVNVSGLVAICGFGVGAFALLAI